MVQIGLSKQREEKLPVTVKLSVSYTHLDVYKRQAQRVGGKGIWHVIDKSWITNADRFEGDIEEERKLFYVAVTRAKKYLYLTRSVNGHDKYISPFLEEAKESSYLVKYDGNIQYDPEHLPNMKQESMPISLNFSLLEDYFECPYRFKLSMFCLLYTSRCV